MGVKLLALEKDCYSTYKLQTDLKHGTSLAELYITDELYSSNVRPSSPAPVCRCGLSTGRAVGAAPPLAAAHRGFPGASATQLCPSAGHLSQGLLSGVGRWALPVRVPPNTPFSTPLPTCPPALPSPTWARERVQQNPRRRRWTGPFPCRKDRVDAEPRPGPCSTHRPRAAAAAAGAGAAAPWAAAGGVRVPAAALCSAAERVGVSRSAGGPAIKGCFLPRAGSPAAGAQVQAVLSIWPEGRSCRWKSRRELGAVTRAAERGAGTGGHTLQLGDGGRLSAPPHLPALGAVFSFRITAVPR